VLHLVLTVVTLGLWLPIWILIAIFANRQPTVVTTAAAGGGGAAPTYHSQPPAVGYTPVPPHLAAPTPAARQIWDAPAHAPLQAGEPTHVDRERDE
jgi:hypothetical protein